MTPNPDSTVRPEALLAETGWLRRLAASLVPQAEREDLVQETLLSALRYPPQERRGLRPWLAAVARNLAGRRRSREDNRRQREAAVARPEGVPSVADAVETFATHQAVVNAVMGLEEPYRSTILLRFWEDLPPREVASRMDVPVETVRTRTKRGLARLRVQLDADTGDRRSWVIPLFAIPGVRDGEVASVAAAAATAASVPSFAGALVMNKFFLAGAAIGAAALLYWTTTEPTRPGVSSPDGEPERIAAAPEIDRLRAARNASAEPSVRVPSDTAAPGTLRVRVRFADGSAAEDVGVYVRDAASARLGTDHRTDAAGNVVVSGLRPGDYVVDLDRCPGREVAVRPGGEHACSLTIPRGLRVEGVVDARDADGGDAEPVPGAVVYAVDPAHQDFAQRVAVCDDEGRFTVRDVVPGTALMARAPRWQPSESGVVRGKPGDTVRTALGLGAPGYRLSGQVVDADGKPAARAIVVIGVDEMAEKRPGGLTEIRRRDGDHKVDRDAFFLRADDAGRFVTEEVPWGEVLVLARIGDRIGAKCTLIARDSRNTVQLHLQEGATVSGFVRDSDGRPLPGVRVVAKWEGSAELGDLESELARGVVDRETVSGPDGSYRLAGLAPGEVRIGRRFARGASRMRQLELAPSQQERLDLVSDRRWTLRVTLQDAAGKPLAGWGITVGQNRLFPPRRENVTNARGVLELPDLAAPGYLLAAYAPVENGFARTPTAVQQVRSDEPEVLIAMTPDRVPSARLSGRLLEHDGRPAADGVLVFALRGVGVVGVCKTGAGGAFESELLLPGEYTVAPAMMRVPRFPLATATVLPRQHRSVGDLRLPEAAELIVEVVAADGAAFQRPAVYARTSGDKRFGSRLSRASGGRHRRFGMPVGRTTLTVIGEDLARYRKTIVLKGGRNLVRLECPRGVVQPFTVFHRADRAAAADPRRRGESVVDIRVENAERQVLVDERVFRPFEDPAARRMEFEFRLAPGEYRARVLDRWGFPKEPASREIVFEVPATGTPRPVRIDFR